MKAQKQTPVLHLIDSAGMYGAEKVVLTLLRGLRDSHFPGTLGCIRESDTDVPELAREAESYKIKVHYFTMRRGFNPLGLIRIGKFISKNQVRIIHTHGYKSDIYLMLLLRKKFKTIASVHGWSKKSANLIGRTYELLDSFALNRMDTVVAVSEGVKDDLAKRGLTRAKINLVYNGITIDAEKSRSSRSEVRRQHGVSDTDFVIGTLGRLAPIKGHRYLIQALPSILNKVKNCRLVIAGEGPLRNELETLINQQNLSDHVKLIGYIKNIDPFMEMIDLFILPSLSEGLPISLLEGMAYGKPVVASHVGGIPEVIGHRSEGLLVPPADPEAISKAVIELIENRVLIDRISSAGRKLVRTKFSSANMVAAYLSLYSDLIGQWTGETEQK